MDLLILDLEQHQPTVVPASDTVRVTDDEPLGFIKAFRAERVVLCQTSELAEKVVRIHVVRPRTGHGLRYLGRVHICKDLFDAAELRDGVDAMSSQRVDELIFVVL